MPKKNRQARASKSNGQNSAAGQLVSEEDRNALQMMPQLTMVTASTATVFKDIERAATVRQNRQWASAGWAYVMAHFHEIPLRHEEGEYDNASGDYGALRSRFIFESQPEDGDSYGLKFLGTKSYDKKGSAKSTLGVSTRPHTTFLQNLFLSLAATSDMVLINPRAGVMRGLKSNWHTDANTRGAHPNAMRCLDAGGGLHIDRRISFRCSLVYWKGAIILPLDLNPVHFRWVEWDAKEVPRIEVHPSQPTIFPTLTPAPPPPQTLGADVYWAALEASEFETIGCIGGSLITMGGGFIYMAPMNYMIVCDTKANLIPLTFQEALSKAEAEPIPPEHGPPQLVGDDPTSWFVFFGWRYPHEWVGNPWIRRAHVTGCPYRQNGTGQNRRAGGGEEEGEERRHPSIPLWRLELEQLQVGCTVSVKWKCGNWWLGEVMSVDTALYATDVGVHILYEDGVQRCEPLMVMEWEVV